MQAKESHFDMKKTARGSVPSLPYEKIARDILGAKYHLSLVICGDALARSINKTYRQKQLGLQRKQSKTYAPNVLSFPLSKNEGEIFLNARKAAREARREKVSHKTRLALLYVHGCFHLKGLKHGNKMEAEEEKILKKYKLLG